MTEFTFFLGLVSKHRSEGYVTNALHALDRGVVLVINDYTAPVVDLHANLVQTKTFGVWPTTDGDEHNIGFEGLLLAALRSLGFDSDGAVVLLVCGEDLGVQLEFDALLGEDFLE